MARSKYITKEGLINEQAIETEISLLHKQVEEGLSYEELKKVRAKLYRIRKVYNGLGEINARLELEIQAVNDFISDYKVEETEGILIDTVRIIRLDDYNYSYEVLKKIKSKDGTIIKWSRVFRYYPTLDAVLKAVKEEVVMQKVALKKYSPKTFIEAINKIQNAVVNMKVGLGDVINTTSKSNNE